jgi:TolB-like protein/DNA-binding winged helix-turn-helix (wHTH) protein/Tfp pilus assembly protein PilF
VAEDQSAPFQRVALTHASFGDPPEAGSRRDVVDVPVANDVVQFAGFRFDRRSGGLFRDDTAGGSTPLALGARALDVLAVLVAHPGELVSKQAIMQAVWPGMLIEDRNLAVQMSALRRVLDEGRSEGSCIQTEAGRGYRFVAAVTRAEREPPPQSGVSTPALPAAEPPADAPPRLPVRQSPLRRRTIAGAVVAAGVPAVMLAAWVWNSTRIGTDSTQRPRLSIVVLPFQNLSDAGGDDYLDEAITDDLTSDLSRVPGMFVIARQTAYTYQGKTVDIRKVGEELGVRYALEGSVRRLGDQLRVNAQLVATETGAHLWADRFDQQLKDLSAGQEEIVRRIGQTLRVAVMDVESARSKRERPINPDAFDLIIRARSIGLHPMGPQEHAERLDLFEQALRLDPTSILALTGVAYELIRLTAIAGRGEELQRASRLIAAAAAISPNHVAVLDSTAYLLVAQGRYAEALPAYQRVLDEYPNSDSAYNQIGYCLVYAGRAAAAIPMIETAMRLNPRSEFNYSRYENMSFALLVIGRYEESIVWSQRALAANPAVFPHLRAQHSIRIAAAHALLGRSDEARRALAEAQRVWPYDTVRAHWPADPSSRAYAAQIERYQAALRLAGHRDHADEDADFGAVSDDKLHADLDGLTPTTVPGANTIRTAELGRLLAERKPVVIDPMMYSWGRSIPGAVGLKRAGSGVNYSDEAQDRLRGKMQALTKGDLATPIVAIGFNSERFDGRNLALRLVALGYTQVYWYRGGREAWEVAGLSEAPVDVQDW